MTDSPTRAESESVTPQAIAAAAPLLPAPPLPSFRDVFDSESSYVWNTLQRLGVQTRDLEDVTHDVMLAVHRRLADFDASRPLRPWIFGIALRVAMRYRDLARHRRELMGLEVEAVDETPGPEEQLVTAQARGLVMEALDALDMDRRAVLVMHDIDGHGIPEVAESLDIPLNTAYSRLRRAREQFKGAVKRIRLRRGVP